VSEHVIRAAHEHLSAKYGGDERHAFVADPHVQTTAGGRSVVRLQQQNGGIPVFGGDMTLLVDGDEVAVLGEVAEVVTGGDGIPDVSALEAITAAIAHFVAKSDRSVCQVRHQSLRGRKMPVPSILGSFPFPSRPTMFRLGRADSWPAAHLVYYLENGAARLAWVVRMPFRAQSHLVFVAAGGEDKGRVILCTRWSAGARCFGTVFSWDHTAAPQRVEFPLPRADFPHLLPHPNSAFVGPWVTLDRIAGNNAIGFVNNKESIVQAVMSGGNLEFPPFAPKSVQQTLLTTFFYCNLLHDFFLMLGFGETESNFQLNNFSSPKGAKDRLEIRVFEAKHANLGDMDAKDDGKPPRLSLGLAPNKEPSGAHAELVIHEYTHGVVHRMVGGRLGTLWLIQQQSLAMDEGWGDYFAITLRNHYLGTTPNYNFADWAGAVNFRTASYDPAVQRDYGKIKQNTPVTHAGEIFAAALIRFNELLGAKLGDGEKGHGIGWRAVIESLRLIVPNPHFLQGRDALIAAIGEMEHGNLITSSEALLARAAAREGFAKYGMGRNAKSVNSAFGGTTSDFNA